MNRKERQELERARQFHIQQDNDNAAEEVRLELEWVSCGHCSPEDCCAPHCSKAIKVTPEIPE